MTPKSDNNPENASAERRVALFAGSFNPFTIGHLSIVERAIGLFDHIVVGIGINIAKPGAAEDAERLADDARRALARFGDRVSVTHFSGLAVDEAARHGARFLLRGVRSVADFEYERNMADLNRRIGGGIETVMLPALPELGAISSSAVRELRAFGRDVAEFLP